MHQRVCTRRSSGGVVPGRTGRREFEPMTRHSCIDGRVRREGRGIFFPEHLRGGLR